MIRIQIQITPDQATAVNKLAAREGFSVSELIRCSLDQTLRTAAIHDQASLRKKDAQAAGIITGPKDLAEKHDEYCFTSLQPGEVDG